MNWLKQWALFVVGWIESAHKLSSKNHFVCNSVCSTFLRNCKLISNLIRLKHGKSYELISRKIGYIKNPLATEAVLFSKKEMLYDWRVLELNLPLDEFYTTQCTKFYKRKGRRYSQELNKMITMKRDGDRLGRLEEVEIICQ